MFHGNTIGFANTTTLYPGIPIFPYISGQTLVAKRQLTCMLQ